MQLGASRVWFDQTPPAIFPTILGLFGIGHGWRLANDVFGFPSAFGEMILGGVSLLFCAAAISYLIKVSRRAGVYREDLHILPGRAGLSAATAAAMLLAATLVPYSTSLASIVLLLAVALHLLTAVTAASVLSAMPLEGRRVTPDWHLVFVAFIVAPLAATPLGWLSFSEIILVLTVPIALTVWGSHWALVSDHPTPPPLRPLLAIHLAPICLFGIVAAGLGLQALAIAFGILSVIGAGVLVARAVYLTEAGFTPLWGAFTFPMASFASVMLVLAPGSGVFRAIGGIALIAATLVVAYITWRTVKMWTSGSLAAKTNAAKV